jgi:hypothetical protein
MERNKLYPLEEVIIITIPAVIALAQGWEDIEQYANAKKDWLGRFLKLEHGIPPHDVYCGVLCRLKHWRRWSGAFGLQSAGVGASDTERV